MKTGSFPSWEASSQFEVNLIKGTVFIRDTLWQYLAPFIYFYSSRDQDYTAELWSACTSKIPLISRKFSTLFLREESSVSIVARSTNERRYSVPPRENFINVLFSFFFFFFFFFLLPLYRNLRTNETRSNLCKFLDGESCLVIVQTIK